MARGRTGTGSNYLSRGADVVTAPPFSVVCIAYCDYGTGNRAGFLYITDAATETEAWELVYHDGASLNNSLRCIADDGSGPSGNADVDLFPDATYTRAVGVWAAANDRRVYYTDSTNKATDNKNEAVSTIDITAFPSRVPDVAEVTTRVHALAIYEKILGDAEVDLFASERVSPFVHRDHYPDHYYPLLGGTGGEADIVGGLDVTETGTVDEAGGPVYRGPRVAYA